MKLTQKASIYFAACNAAQDALPEGSREKIRILDSLHDAYIKAWDGKGRLPSPSKELQEARLAVYADPLAKIAMDLRALGNQAQVEDSETYPKGDE